VGLVVCCHISVVVVVVVVVLKGREISVA